MSDHPPSLGYATPGVLFEHVNRSRDVNQIIGGIVLAGAGVAIGYATHGRWLHGAGPSSEWIPPAVAAMMIGISLVVFYEAVINRERSARITTDGIEPGRRHFPWPRVASVYGQGNPNFIRLYFTTADRPWWNRAIAVVPPLTSRQFDDVMRTLTRHVGRRYPDVVICAERRDDSGY